jgi:hypothetical protein
MIRIASPAKSARLEWHEVFLKMLPAIKNCARVSFRNLRADERAEAIQNVLCLACAATARLAELNKLDLCYPSVLSRYAIALTRDGRVLGHSRNCRDVLSTHCQRRKGIIVKQLDEFDLDEGAWQEVLVADQTVTPAELAASRIDFGAWLGTLKPRKRRIALTLATGETTRGVARLFNVSEGRVSQLRADLKAAWQDFVGEREPR